MPKVNHTPSKITNATQPKLRTVVTNNKCVGLRISTGTRGGANTDANHVRGRPFPD
jgi:hypothetical protein